MKIPSVSSFKDYKYFLTMTIPLEEENNNNTISNTSEEEASATDTTMDTCNEGDGGGGGRGSWICCPSSLDIGLKYLSNYWKR